MVEEMDIEMAVEELDVEMVSGERSLNDLPDEILLLLFGLMNDTGLLNMTRVCKRFKTIAKEAFEKKYCGDIDRNYYALDILCANEIEEHRQYRPIFTTFGENLTAIKITFNGYTSVPHDHWLICIIRQYCTVLAKIDILFGKNVNLTDIIGRVGGSLTHLRLEHSSLSNYEWTQYNYPNLVSVHLADIVGLEEQRAIEFILNHHQIQNLHLLGDEINTSIFESLNGKLLKSLYICSDDLTGLIASTTVIEMKSLTSLELDLDNSILAPILNAIGSGCTNVERLEVQNNNDFVTWDDRMIKALCKFQRVKSLELCSGNLMVNNLRKIIKSMRYLTSLHLCHAYDHTEICQSVREVVVMCKKLSNLEIDTHSYTKFFLNFNDFQTFAEVTNRNKQMKFTLQSDRLKLIAAQGEVQYDNYVIYRESNAPLPELTDEYMGKFIDYFDEEIYEARYKRCEKTQKAFETYLAKYELDVRGWPLEFNDGILASLGKYIRLMKIRLTDYDGALLVRDIEKNLWQNINKYCTHLTQLTIRAFNEEVIEELNLSWPSVNKLKFTMDSLDYKTLRSIDCPNLIHLEVLRFNTENDMIKQMQDLSHGEAFQHLTVLKFKEYSEDVQQFLSGLNANTCLQMKELSISNLSTFESVDTLHSARSFLKLVNTLVRFRNLTKLHLLIAGIETSNTRLLFENMPNLIEVAIVCASSGDTSILDHIKDNCLEIVSICVISLDVSTIPRSLSKLFPGKAVEILYATRTKTYKGYSVKLDHGAVEEFSMARNLFY